MKRIYKYACLALAAVSMTVVAQDYTLKIHTKSGEVISVPTKDIDSMDFEDEADEGGQLPAPKVSFERVSDNSYTMKWTSVPNAASYMWKFDGATTSYTSDTSYTFKNLTEGTHTFSVKAIAEKNSKYTDSEYETISFRIAPATANMHFILEGYSHNSASVTLIPGASEFYSVAIMPTSAATSDAAIIEIMGNMDKDQVHKVTKQEIRDFADLTPETSYTVAAIPSDNANTVYSFSFTTEAIHVVGSKGTVFPPGVSATAGFVDVDKVGDNNIYGSDKELCWACVAAGMIQWWISDYKAGTGEDYPTVYPIPAESKYYSTPVMDVISQAYTHQAGDAPNTIKWFFVGNEYPAESYQTNDQYTFQLNYEYVNGGFMGMTQSEFNQFREYCSGVDLFKGLSGEGVKHAFSSKMLGWLSHGPVYVCLAGNHALCAWGADYTVEADGSKVITKLYIAENDVRSENMKNALQDAPVHYTDRAGSNTPYINFPTIFDGGTEKSGAIGVFSALKSWGSIK